MFDFFSTHKVILAPMAGVGDEVFRSLCIEAGADLSYTEMVSAQGLQYANERTNQLLDLAPNEAQVAVQLFGHVPSVMAVQARSIESKLGDKLAYIDVNMGCPARKIVKKGDGSALMKDPILAAQIIRSITNTVSCPVTVKFRRGWAEGVETAPEFGLRMQEAGVSACAVHGRYSEQLYRGKASWECIARVKEVLDIPVIGNGDVTDAQAACELVLQTSCDAVMIGRAARGNPWIFSQVKAAFDHKPIPDDPTAHERIFMAKRHAHMLSERSGKNIVRMRKHAMWYMAGLPGASAARRRLDECVTVEDFDAVFSQLEEECYARSL